MHRLGPGQALRNILAHNYEQIDYGLIWNALAVELPVDASAVRRILEERG